MNTVKRLATLKLISSFFFLLFIAFECVVVWVQCIPMWQKIKERNKLSALLFTCKREKAKCDVAHRVESIYCIAHGQTISLYFNNCWLLLLKFKVFIWWHCHLALKEFRLKCVCVGLGIPMWFHMPNKPTKFYSKRIEIYINTPFDHWRLCCLF